MKTGGVWRRWSYPPGAFLLAGLLFAGGCASPSGAYHPPPPLAPAARTELNLRVFDRAWELVNAKYFDAKFRGVDWAAMRPKYRPQAEKAADDSELYHVINAMLGELKESHNAALPPRQVFEYEAKERARIGVVLARVDSHWVITEVNPGSPAEAAGVRRGWLVVSRDGKPFDEMVNHPLTEGLATTYEFLDDHDQARRMVMLPRLISTANRLEIRKLEGDVIYLRFDGFDATSRRWLSDELKTHLTAPAVVVDLRQNPGGWFFSLGITLGEFFPGPVQMGTAIWRSGHQSGAGSWPWTPARYAGRVVLLVGPATASCAEIFADTMHHYHRAALVGRKTAGAVVVARDYSLPDGGRLEVGVEDFLGLDGHRLEGVGVAPDIEVVPLTLAEVRAGRDADLEAAQRILRN